MIVGNLRATAVLGSNWSSLLRLPALFDVLASVTGPLAIDGSANAFAASAPVAVSPEKDHVVNSLWI
jgi:hypothetical protein